MLPTTGPHILVSAHLYLPVNVPPNKANASNLKLKMLKHIAMPGKLG